MFDALHHQQQVGAIPLAVPSTLLDVMERHGRQKPDAVVFRFLTDGEAQEQCVTYREIIAEAKRIGAMLQRLGAAGARILLVHAPGLDFIHAFFGCLYAGAIAVPAYPPNPSQLDRSLFRLAAIVADAEPQFALTSEALVPLLEGVCAGHPVLGKVRWIASDGALEVHPRAFRGSSLRADDVAMLQYTSGSTGTPKGVILTHANLMNNQAAMQHHYETTSKMQFISWLPLYHDMGLIGGLMGTLYAGGTATLMSPLAFMERPVRWLQAITRYRGTYTCAPNFAFALCTRKVTAREREELDLSSLEFALVGAEPIRPATLEAFATTFRACGFRRTAFYPAYGLAEGTVLLAGGRKGAEPRIARFNAQALERHLAVPAKQDDAHALEFVSCGRLIPDHVARIVDPATFKSCEDGVIGELWVSGPSVSKGYWNKPEATRDTFGAMLDSGEGPFLRTGDHAFMTDGELHITGRIKDLIILAGKNHYPQDIEAGIDGRHPRIRPGGIAAFSVEERGAEQLVVAVEINAQGLPTEAAARAAEFDAIVGAIRRAVSDRHDIDVRAVALVRAGTLPKTSSGKIQRRATAQAFREGTLAPEDHVVQCMPANVDTREPNLVALQTVPEHQRWDVLADYLAKKISSFTQTPLAARDLHQARMLEMGLGSLMLLELSTSMGADLDIEVPMSHLLRGSVGDLVNVLLDRMRLGGGRAVPVATVISAPENLLYNPFEPSFVADPYPIYERLRREDCVHRGALPAWVITRHEDVYQGFRDRRLSVDSRHQNMDGTVDLGRVGGTLSAMSGWIRREESLPLARLFNNAIATLEPPRHTRMRQLLSRAFTPAVIERLRMDVRERARNLVADMERRGSAEVMRDFALLLPIATIAQMIGMPREDIPMLRQWSQDLTDAVDPFISHASFERAGRSAVEFSDYVRRHVELRRTSPARDLLHLMCEAEINGDRLTMDELVANCMLLFITGFETTTGMIGNGLLALHRHPAELALLRREPTLLGNAVEELLRYDGSVRQMQRTAVEDMDMQGRTIRRGDIVLLVIGAANRDPEKFPDPDRLDIRRDARDHVAFGYGRHFCIGAHLARMQMQEAIHAVVQNAPNMRILDDQMSWRRSLALRILDRLPVTFE